MAKDDPHFRLRIPADLKKIIEEAAVKNNRSINAEIVARLEERDSATDALVKALDVLEDVQRRSRHEIDVLKWMNEQQKMLVALVEAIAETDGNLDPDFMAALRKMAASRGQNNAFPDLDDADEKPSEPSPRIEGAEPVGKAKPEKLPRWQRKLISD